MRVTFKVLDSLSSAPRRAANPAPQGAVRMPPASRGPPSSGDPDRMMRISKLLTPRGVPPRSGLGSVTGVPVRPESRSALQPRS